MLISVIIPVYNAAPFVRDAVESALAQPETAEVILVEDGSPDDSLAICTALAAEYDCVKLYRHPDGENRGAGASRNLGIINSTSDYIAFLDADDVYLPGRFCVAERMLEADPTLDGVYEAIGLEIDSQTGWLRWQSARRSTNALYTITTQISPEQLFDALIRGGVGFFTVNGLTVRRSIFNKTGLYDEHLRLHQDHIMNFKMAAVARLAPGRLEEAVATYRIHENNRISAPRPQWQVYSARMKMWFTMWEWSRRHLTPDKQQRVVFRLVAKAMSTPLISFKLPQLLRPVQGRLQLILITFVHPRLALTRVFWQRLLALGVVGKVLRTVTTPLVRMGK